MLCAHVATNLRLINWNKCIIYQGPYIVHACPVCNLTQQSEVRPSFIHTLRSRYINLLLRSHFPVKCLRRHARTTDKCQNYGWKKVEIKILEPWPEQRQTMQMLFPAALSQDFNALCCCKGSGTWAHGWMSRLSQDKQKQQLRTHHTSTAWSHSRPLPTMSTWGFL